MSIPGMPGWALPDPVNPPGPPLPLDPPLIQGQPDGSLVVYPMVSPQWWGQGYALPSGPYDDAITLNQALLQSGKVRLAANAAYDLYSTVNIPYNAELEGQGVTSVLRPHGNITALNWHNPVTGQSITTYPTYPGGRLAHFVIDGAALTGTGTALNMGDTWGMVCQRLRIQNCTAAGAVALHVQNQFSWTEKARLQVTLINNATAAVFDGAPASNSMEYNLVDFEVWADAGQQGIVWENAVYLSGGWFRCVGNMRSSTSALSTAWLTLMDTAHADGVEFDVAVEIGGNNTFGPMTVNYAGSQGLQSCHGLMRFFNGGSGGGWVASNVPNTKFGFQGIVEGDTNLSAITVSQPAVPAASTPITNPANCPCSVSVNGGTGVTVSINGTSTGRSSGDFVVPAYGTISLGAYTVAPTWNWARAA